MRILTILMLVVLSLPLAAAESQRDVFSVLTRDGKIEQGFFKGYKKGFFLLEQQKRILRLSPAHVMGIFNDRLDAEKTIDDRAWLDSQLSMKVHPKEREPVVAPKPGPEAKTKVSSTKAPPEVTIPEGGSEREKAYFALLPPKDKEGMDRFFGLCLREAKEVVEDYRRQRTLKKRVREVLPMLKGLDKYERTMLEPETFRPVVLVMTLISGHLRETVGNAQREGGAPAVMKAFRGVRKFQTKIMQYWAGHVMALDLSDLPEDEKEKAKARAKQLGNSLKPERGGGDTDRKGGGRPLRN